MKNLVTIYIVFISVFCFSQADFYYTTNNEKEFFHTVTGKWSVEFYDTITNYPNTKIAEQFSIVTDTSDLSLFSTNYRVNPLYITQTGGIEMVLTSNIILHFNENVTNQEKQNLITQFGLRNVESNNIYDLYSCDSVININNLTIDLSNFSNGAYTVALVVNGNVVDAKTLIVN